MGKKMTTEEFITKAKSIHGDIYDYSECEYINSRTKVNIICPKHGMFQQKAGSHLEGVKCKQCAIETAWSGKQGESRRKIVHEKRSMSTEEFITKAKAIHGDAYDYSECEYVNSKTKVKIICPKHGVFEQEASSHLMGHGCAICMRKESWSGEKGEERRKKSYTNERQTKMEQTCMKRYGAKTYALSSKGKEHINSIKSTPMFREKMRNIIKSDDVQAKTMQTNINRYGVESPMKLEEYRTLMHEKMLSPEIRNKVKRTSLERYGAEHFLKSDIGRKKFRKTAWSKESRKVARETNIQRYGANSWSESNEGRVFLSEYLSSPEVQQKIHATKTANHSFNTSKPEEKFYEILIQKFGEDDVIRQYRDERYNFACDFYIKSMDLFIELNLNWTHGDYWFDETSDKDIEKCKRWKSLGDMGKKYYYNALDTWTKRDVIKRNTARENDLNYVVFWKSNLYDAKQWLNSGCTPRKDWL